MVLSNMWIKIIHKKLTSETWSIAQSTWIEIKLFSLTSWHINDTLSFLEQCSRGIVIQETTNRTRNHGIELD